MTTSSAVTPAGAVDPRLSDEALLVPGLAAATPSLKRLALSGTAWTLLGHAAGETLRFGSHLLCAWLLDPAVFGVMVMVNVVLQGLKMFSDLGTGASIIQHPRGDEGVFLDTAWTIQVIRGACLFLAAGALAGPVALYRGHAELMLLIPVAAVSGLLNGFNSTAPATLHRRMELRKLTIFDLSWQFAGSAATVICVLLMRNVWALVLGGVIRAAIRLVSTHTVIAQRPNRFAWDKKAVTDLVRFGRWIFIATALTFLCTQGDKLILAGTWSDHDLGLYGIAFFLAMAIPGLMRQQANRVLFPLYARISQESPDSLRAKMRRVRLWLHVATLGPMCVLAIWGQPIAQLLYTDEYQGLGWILQILALGGIFHAVELTMSPVLLARGDSFRHMLVLVSRAVLLVACMIAGGLLDGQFGFVLGVAAAQVLYYPVLAWAVHRHGVWMPRLDLLAMASPAAVVALGILLFT
jgi:O-antigen/teichoic acid export membrane protein